MSRAERRRLKNAKPEPVYNLTASQLEGMKQQATNDAIEQAFTLLLAFPTMVIHDKFDQLAELPDAQRTRRMGEMIVDLYDSFNRDYVSLKDLHEWLREEVGLEIYLVGDHIRLKTIPTERANNG